MQDVQRLYFLSMVANAYHQAAHAEAAGAEPYDEPGQLAIDEHEHDFYNKVILNIFFYCRNVSDHI